MTILFLLISLASLALAGGMAIVVSRMRREERARADARVAVLSQMAATDFLPETEPSSAMPADPDHATAGGLFAGATAASPWPARLAIAAAIVAVLLVSGGIALFRSPATDARMAGHVGAAPLELQALEHTQQGGTLTVSGWVKNPAGATPAVNLTATVFLFGPDGSFLTSGRAPLHTPTLEAGAESPFLVAIPVNGPVTRYRVSFRDSSGHPVAHVDRRSAASVARSQ